MTAMRQRFRSAVGCLLCILSMLQCFNLSIILSACSSDEEEQEVPQVPAQTPVVEEMAETAITFSGNEGEEQTVTRAPMTRAGTPLSEKATSFKVWGHKSMDYDEGTGVYSGDQTVFPGYGVEWQTGSAATSSTNSNGWEYILAGNPDQTIKYWDWAAAAYRFFAVTGWGGAPPTPPVDIDDYEANEAYGADGGDGTYRLTMLANAEDDTEMAKTPFFTRMWFSTGDPVAYPDKQFGRPVILEFLKPYSRVRIMFNYSYAEEGIKLKDISFKPSDASAIALKGLVTIIYPLEGASVGETYSVTPDDGVGAPTLEAFTEEYIPEGNEKWYTVLPRHEQGSYTLSVSVNNVIKEAVVPSTFMRWLPGYSYTYIFKITEEGGVEIEAVFTAVTPWTEMENDYAVYNW